MKEKAYFNWSSGKDSALALYLALDSGRFDVKALLTTVNRETEHIPMHEVPVGLLYRQAECIGVPLTVVSFDVNASLDGYQAAMQKAMDSFRKQEIGTALFGDIYLEGVRQRREKHLSGSGIKARFPLWGMPPREVLRAFIGAGFSAIVTCVDGSVLDKSFVGRLLHDSFLDDLPSGVDVCGENGEYHSFVFDGPIFHRPVEFVTGEVYSVEYPPNPETEKSMGKWSDQFWYLPIAEKME